MSEERIKVLKMLEEGQITSEEAVKLLESIDAGAGPEGGTITAARWLRVRVTDYHSGRAKVNVNLPLSLLNVALKFVPKDELDLQGIDLNAIVEAIKEGAQGKLVEVVDEDEGSKVEIVVE